MLLCYSVTGKSAARKLKPTGKPLGILLGRVLRPNNLVGSALDAAVSRVYRRVTASTLSACIRPLLAFLLCKVCPVLISSAVGSVAAVSGGDV